MTATAAALPVSLPLAAPGRVTLLEGDRAIRTLDFAAAADMLRPGNVFHSRAMLEAAAKAARSAGMTVLAACASRNGAIQTVWPLRITRDLGVGVATDLADPVSQYSDVIGAPFDGFAIAELCDMLRRDYRADVLLARRVRADSGLDQALRDSNASVIDTGLAPFADLAAIGSFDAYMASFSKSTARKMRQRRAKLEAAAGALSFEVLQGEAALQAIRTAIQWKRYWLQKQAFRSRVFDGAGNEAALVEAAMGSNARTSVMRADGRPVAVELGFLSGTHYSAYLGTFAPDVAQHSAGQEQMLRTIEWCFAQGFASYDLLPPDDDYKRHWTRGDTAHPVRDYGVALSRVGGMYVFVRRHARARVQRAVEAMPAGMRQVARRYVKVAIGVGGTAAAITLLND